MIFGGVITDSTQAGSSIVHEYRQAPVMVTRFTPLYRNSLSNKVTQQITQRPNDVPVNATIDPNNIVGVGSIVNFQIDNALLNALRAQGIADEPAP